MNIFSEEIDPQWYKDAIIYELHVRAFCDSNADGIGDFKGLTHKLDYLHDLGVTAIWLLPFCSSPLRDDGYDISDYKKIHPPYGTLRNFQTFVREAHSRKLRVITELVLNHTSDQHPWFQRARKAPPGSKWRNWYVWSEKPNLYSDARIIFRDTEQSNWTWDPVAKAFFWHRFFSHQPDLNYENSDVQKAIFEVLDFWLELGVDGLRLDAVPYLYEREGTNCENLPQTHVFLRALRKHVDKRFQNRLLLAEANQWPEDASAYFGNGDECQMNFHFPLMPRLIMAMQREDRFPIIDILEQTQTLAIPESCQWGLFLRSHEELTGEIVTDEDRDSMHRVMAHDKQVRNSLGFPRRLAPLLGNNKQKIELMFGLLFSMPGTPVIYYGEEIGMGDNYHLGDRNGVRTPMQWSADRNAGFSYTNPQKLYLPIVIDPEYHYESVNVELQQNNAQSLVWWMKRIVTMRKSYMVFGRGGITWPKTVNTKVLVFLRELDEECVLCMFNLSRIPQQIKIDLSEYKGRVPLDVMSSASFFPIGERPYSFLLSPHQFYWIDISRSSRKRTDFKKQQDSESSELDFRGDDLSGMDFGQYTDLRNDDFSDTNLKGVNLKGLNLSGADFRGAKLVDTILDGATINGAKLWEAKREGWSIRDIVCDHIFWDREARESVQYEPGEFERLFGEKGARVFLSSTVNDLQEYRDAVYKAVDQLQGFQCIRMEDFGAIGEVPLKVCIDQVKACDVFIGILGHSYGSIPPGESKSFTENEYDAASEKDRLIFLTDESLQVSTQLNESDDVRSRQASFRKRAEEELVVATFESPDTLVDNVVNSLKHWRLGKG